MLTGQVGESFAASSMPCADENMMVMRDNQMDHSNHSMSMNKSSVITDEDCCQKDCCCPMGLTNVAMSNEPNIDTPIGYKTTQLLARHSTIHNIFLALPQRPPKTTFS